jgi:integrase
VPGAWHGVTWGLVEGFVRWLLNQGYSVASINNRLSAVKVYARLATRAGAIPAEEHALIREVRGYGETEGKRVDERRPKRRVGYKKDEALVLTAEQARLLKTQYTSTPQGIRDRLLICLLLDLGLRASEVAALRVEDFAEPGYITVYRQKTDSVDRMELTADILKALAAYAPYQRKEGLLLRGSRKTEELTEQNMSVRAIGSRVKILGRDILGLWELSPHDLRHTWATRAAKNSDPFTLRDAGGWTNMQTPGRYVERAKVVNEGIRLDY